MQGPYAVTVVGWHTNSALPSKSESELRIALKVFMPRIELNALREAYPHDSRSSAECMQAVVCAIERACKAPECAE